MLNLLINNLAKELDKLGIPYMIIDGQAVLLYGEPRLTRDVDITLGITPESLDKVLQVVKNLGLNVLVENAEKFVKQTWVLPVYDEKPGFRVDFMFSWTPYEKEALRRVKEINIEGYPVKFASPEDVIIHKVIAGRAKDLEDVKSIIRKQANLDVNLIRKWLTSFSDVLNKDLWAQFESLFREKAE